MVSLTSNSTSKSATMPQPDTTMSQPDTTMSQPDTTKKYNYKESMKSFKPAIQNDNTDFIERNESENLSDQSDSLSPSPVPLEEDEEMDEGIADGAQSDLDANEDDEMFELSEQFAAQALGSPIFNFPVYNLPVLCHYSPPVVPCQSPTYKSDLFINYSMELVWHGEFQRLFQSYLPHTWHLSPTFSLPKGREWVMFKDSAKVRFLCKGCAHGWTSMKGRVVFWFWFDETKGNGIVLFRLFGQRCKVCNPTLFEHAMWYPEEVVKVVGNVFNRIGQEYYRFFRPTVRVDRRAGKPRAKHNTDLCQACTEGICPGEFHASLDPQLKASPLTYNSPEL